MRKSLCRYLYLVLTYLLGMVFFTLFRIANVAVYCFSHTAGADFGGLLFKAMLIGARFDTAVSCYLLILPALLLVVAVFAKVRSIHYFWLLNAFVLVGYGVAFFACVADIPFFQFFFSRLNAVAVNELDSFDIILDMVFSEPKYVLLMVAFLAIMAIYVFVQCRICRFALLCGQKKDTGYSDAVCGVVILFAMFVGLRGGLLGRPIRVNSAYYCADPFLNQLGLNPVFTFVKSAGHSGLDADAPLQLVDPDHADCVFRMSVSEASTSLLKNEYRVDLPEGSNVVIVIMESMSFDKMGSLTPILNELADGALFFTQTYSAGIHTYNGVYSTLYSMPGIPGRHTFSYTFFPRMQGLPIALHDKGYQNTFFMPHDEDYDNMRGFLYANGFDSVVGQHSYPESEVIGPWGIPDHVLFDHALHHCDVVADKGPFFTTILTCSDHVPYIIPDNCGFAPTASKKELVSIQYADWSIGRFLEMARSRSWFENTVFVFIADHGVIWGENHYDMSLSYNHVPMLFYCPKHILPQRIDSLALQIDLGPTLLGMLPSETENNTFGLDLLHQHRRFAYYSCDDKVGVLDGELYYIYCIEDGSEYLYRYAENLPGSILPLKADRAATMKDYALSMIQHAHTVVNGW